MKYQLTCLTPTLVGDGKSLAPIDYMVWKDQVNVLDQQRIFKLFARGPRLDSYLQQLKKAQKLDFASWGGLAQSYADRRIPFDDPSVGKAWEQARPEHLFIPTFAQDLRGPYLPASSMKGALRSGYAFSRFKESTLKDVEQRMQAERPPRRPGEQAEGATVGSGGADRMRLVEAGDSQPISTAALRVYLVRTSSLVSEGKVNWKPNATYFTEMAEPGTMFSGVWTERTNLLRPEVMRALHWRESFDAQEIFRAANDYALGILTLQKQYAERAALPAVRDEVERLTARLAEVSQNERSCLLSLGWGGGMLGKVASLDTNGDTYRAILRKLPYYQRAIQTGMPFPKTRKIVFRQDRPATLPGWCELRIA